jgi:metal-responsive CopG/Arc/MetJ family transcriptional regulator
MQSKTQKRVVVELRREELKAIDDFRFAQRMPNRASAIRELLRCGLAADGMAIRADDKGTPNGQAQQGTEE